ncbi:HNH endonuclease signature motif containing protein [Arthrobacter sp. OY3WO11]|uniref:HNH endonuclease signature motif containing protein n=1 Tax=Arthrobacter sp. OY3WO11 TaxID=1835723 RepID=UPI0007CF75EA|nr:HNH endonuclease signature motif containing protein [Arthrobacter sp. OY3WO11]OAE00496.1 HNH endonuclease [Arthrobacter sp. OY3WO11]
MKVMRNQLAEFGGCTALLSNAGSLAPPGIPRTTSPPPASSTRPVVPSHRSAVAGECTPALAVGPFSLPAPTVDGASGRVEEAGEQPRAGLAGIGDLLNAAALAAPDALAVADYVEASDFAGQVEELARSVECLQLLAARAVDRTRSEAITAATAARSARSRGWVTGWDDSVETLKETDAGWPGQATPANAEPSEPNPCDRTPGDPTPSAATSAAGVAPPAAGTGTRAAVPVMTSPADDGCRNTAEFLRLRLRIPLREARRRLALADQALPGASLTGEPLPPARPHLASALAPAATPFMAGPAVGTATPEETAADTGESTDEGTDGGSPSRASAPVVSSYAGTIITAALDRIRHHTTPDVLDRIEHALTTAAATADPDFLARLAQRWTETIDADGTEPSEEALRHTQGAFIRKPRHGLHRLEIFATTDQYEHLLTAMNAATNPRTSVPAGTGPDIDTDAGSGTDIGPCIWTVAGSGTAVDTVLASASGDGSGTVQDTAWNDAHQDPGPDLERRTRPQKQLDGIIGAVKAGLTTNALPITGGNRPQIIATINYQDLFPHRATNSGGQETGSWSRGAGGASTRSDTSASDGTGTDPGARTGAGSCANTSTVTGTGPRSGAGNFVFTGPVAAATLRKIACDADIIPAVLGTRGEILDLGRKTRLFTPAQRLALTARDQGCTFPNCTIPAPWCEAHHITYWSDGGPTTTDNGALLCSAHHHLVHKEQWTITSRHGTPWFTPPPHIDPQRKPQRNHYFRPPPPPRTQRE